MSSKVHLFSDIQNRKIWCPSRTSNSVAHMMSSIWSQEACLVYKFGYVVYTHSMFEHSCSLTWIHVLSYYTYCLRQYLFIYAPGSNDQGHIVFVLSVCLFFVCLFVCLSVCLLSTLTFAITFELKRGNGDFIFSMHTPLMKPFQMTPRSMTLWPWLWPWS